MAKIRAQCLPLATSRCINVATCAFMGGDGCCHMCVCCVRVVVAEGGGVRLRDMETSAYLSQHALGQGHAAKLGKHSRGLVLLRKHT